MEAVEQGFSGSSGVSCTFKRDELIFSYMFGDLFCGLFDIRGWAFISGKLAMSIFKSAAINRLYVSPSILAAISSGEMRMTSSPTSCRPPLGRNVALAYESVISNDSVLLDLHIKCKVKV